MLPREKPVPREKKLTRWEQYAKLKGIQNKKKSRMVWDEELKEWRPRWGYKRANDESNIWAIDVPKNADPMEDQFAKLSKAKNERIAKNELQRLRNIARASKSKVPGVGLTPTDRPDKDQLKRAIVETGRANASLGTFMNKLPKERPVSGMGKKRKSNTADINSEKKAALDILQKIQSSKPSIDCTSASNRLTAQQEKQRKTSGKSKAGPGGKNKKKTGQPNLTKAGKKGKMRGGKRKGGRK